MLIGVISDIHSNAEALTKVMTSLNEKKVDKVVCLGDVVGYGPDPEECIDLIKNLTKNIVAGNHDYGVGGLTQESYFSPIAKSCIDWTKQRLDQGRLTFLRILPLSINWGSVLFLHSSPDAPDMWNYIMTSSDAIVQFRFFEQNLLFVGHTHIPGIWDETGKFLPINDQPFKLDTKRRFIINPGSVGQPRDGNPDSSFAIFDTDKWVVKFYRVKYDVESTSAKIKNAELPLILSERIKWGQ